MANPTQVSRSRVDKRAFEGDFSVNGLTSEDKNGGGSLHRSAQSWSSEVEYQMLTIKAR